MKILVVDDQILFREALVGMLESQPDMIVAGEAGSVQEAVQAALETEPDVILMDFSLPDGDGVDATVQILAVLPDVKVVFLTIHDASDRVLSAVRSGAKGYLLKELPFAKLVASLRGLYHDEAAMSRKMVLRMFGELSQSEMRDDPIKPQPADLTSCEQQILRELAMKSTNMEIADHLSMSLATVKNHLHKMFIKLNLQNRVEAARYARHLGLLKKTPADPWR